MTMVTNTTRLFNPDKPEEYPVYLYQLNTKIENALIPEKIDSEALVSFNYFPVTVTPRPAGDIVEEGPPVFEDGEWKTTYVVREHTSEENESILKQAKDAALVNIEQLRVAQFRIGFPHLFGADGDIYHVQVRDADRTNILSYRVMAKEAITEGRAETFSVEFRVYENVSVQLTAQEMVEMADASVQHVLSGYQEIWALKEQTLTATRVEDIPQLPATIFTL